MTDARRQRHRPNLKSISRREETILLRAREEAKNFDNPLFAEMYVEALERRVRHDDPALYSFMTHLEQAPVSIEDFIDDKEFLGATDLTLWPEVRAAAIAINKDWWKGQAHGAYVEAILSGATGCVDSDTEYLTPYGWRFISDFQPHDKIAVYSVKGSITFEPPQEYVMEPCRNFLQFSTRTVNQVLTTQHRVVYRSPKTGGLLEKPAIEVADSQNHARTGFRGQIITAFSAGVQERPGVRLTDEQLRLMVAVIADGHLPTRSHGGVCHMRLKKDRKKERICQLLEAAGVDYKVRECAPYEGFVRVVFDAPIATKSFNSFWGATQHQLEVIAEECLLWDGDTTYRDRFFTANKDSADFIQYAFSCTGRTANISTFQREGEATEYTVLAQSRDYVTMAGGANGAVPATLVDTGDGYCYCFRTSTSMWVARRGDKVFVTGNTGKTSLCEVTTLYHLHILACLKQPQTLYGLPKTTSIIFPIMAAKPHVTKKVVYQPIRKMIEDIPWFQKHLQMDKLIESEVYFKEKNIRIVVGGADADSILGEAVIGGIIDEINFMNVVLKSKKSEVTSGRMGIYDQAQTIYEAMTRRKKSRFINKGPQIGIILVSSSTRYKGDFTDKRTKHVETKHEKGVYIYNKKQYEVWPQDRYTGETFNLMVGNEVLSDTRVMEDNEVVPEGTLVLAVPIEYKSDFLKNPHDSLRDIVGISTSSISPFFRRRFKILECIQAGEAEGLQSFLVKDNVVLGVDGLPQVKSGHYCMNPSRPRYVHIDLSLNNDNCIAAGQQVLLADGTYRSIELVREGDKVITQDGSTQHVTATHDNGCKKVLSVGVYGWPDNLVATPNHRVWAVKRSAVSYASGRLVKPNAKKFTGRSSKAAKARYKFTPEFVELSTLSPGDFLVTPRPKQAEYLNLGGIPLTYAAGYIAGLFAAEGSLYCVGKQEHVAFSLHENETEILRRLTDALVNTFGVKVRVIHATVGKGVQIRTSSCKALTAFVYASVGEYSHRKHMKVWRTGNSAFHSGLCHGYVDGGGCVAYDDSGATTSFAVKSVSPVMARSFYWLLTANGYTATIDARVGYTSEYKGTVVTHKPCWTVKVSGRAQLARFAAWGAGYDETPCSMTMALEEYILRPIQTVAMVGSARVYDLTIEGNSSYVVGTSVVHNCGIAMLRFDGLRKVTREGGQIEALPICSVEMAVSIKPDAQNEIQIAEIRMWVKQLRDVFGYPIKAVTYDGLMGIESQQQWRKDGMKTGYVSVDKTSVPYKQLRDAISDTRVLMYHSDVLLNELFELEYDTVKDKVDHPINGGKDVADSVCGAYTTLLQRRSSWMAAASDDAAHVATERRDYESRFDDERFV